MKRFAPLALIVLALAAVPAAFADDSTPAPTQPTATTPATQPAPQNAGRPGIRMRIESRHGGGQRLAPENVIGVQEGDIFTPASVYSGIPRYRAAEIS